MFCRKQAKKRCHPCIKLAIFTAGAVGMAAIFKKGKKMMTEKFKSVVKFVKNGCKSEGCE